MPLTESRARTPGFRTAAQPSVCSKAERVSERVELSEWGANRCSDVAQHPRSSSWST